MSISLPDEVILNEQGYTIVRQLGEGSYAKVYLAKYTSPNDNRGYASTLACKVVDIEKAPRDFAAKFFPRELDIIRKLDHPYVIRVHSILHRRTKYFIFMRFAEKGDLLDFILNKGAIIEGQAKIWFSQLASAVKYLHDQDISHRDIKCENVLITVNYNLKLADYGFARMCCDNKGNRVLSSTYCGSLAYAAPEIIYGKPYNPKLSDVWSLGVVLYVMLNKSMPFDDSNAKNQYQKQVKRHWKFRSKVKYQLSVEAKEVVCNMLEPDLEKRWRVDHVIRCPWLLNERRSNEQETKKEGNEDEVLEEPELEVSGVSTLSALHQGPMPSLEFKETNVLGVTEEQTALNTMSNEPENKGNIYNIIMATNGRENRFQNRHRERRDRSPTMKKKQGPNRTKYKRTEMDMLMFKAARVSEMNTGGRNASDVRNQSVERKVRVSEAKVAKRENERTTESTAVGGNVVTVAYIKTNPSRRQRPGIFRIFNCLKSTDTNLNEDISETEETSKRFSNSRTKKTS